MILHPSFHHRLWRSRNASRTSLGTTFDPASTQRRSLEQETRCSRQRGDKNPFMSDKTAAMDKEAAAGIQSTAVSNHDALARSARVRLSCYRLWLTRFPPIINAGNQRRRHLVGLVGSPRSASGGQERRGRRWRREGHHAPQGRWCGWQEGRLSARQGAVVKEGLDGGRRCSHLRAAWAGG